ncbi:MAG: hypothetical protein KGO82_01920 [Bacteroidota bacterium]|nr:hypothetical protein [Bacteroidota bacterium]
MSKSVFFTAAIAVIVLTLLGWQHFHGGVPAHHILARKDLPVISNWWGALLIPLLTWISLQRVKRRTQIATTPGSNRKSWLIFFAGLGFGISIAIAFTNDFQPFLENVPYILLLLALLIPIFYAEFILGFVLGMSYTFGAVLPTIFVLVMAGAGFILYRFVRPVFLKLFKKSNK